MEKQQLRALIAAIYQAASMVQADTEAVSNDIALDWADDIMKDAEHETLKSGTR